MCLLKELHLYIFLKVFVLVCGSACMYVYLCTTCVPGVHGPSQKQQVLLTTEVSAQFTSVSLKNLIQRQPI